MSTDSDSTHTSKEPKAKLSLYQRYQEWKRGPAIRDEDIKKHLGVTKSELMEWADSQPGVGRNQLAGSIAAGPVSGFGGMAAGSGYGGWGPSSAPNDKNRGMKFPPNQQNKEG